MLSHRAPTHRPARFGIVAVALVLGAVVFSSIAGDAAVASTAADRLPDLAMRKPSHLVIQTTSTGRRRLRLTTTIVNLGKGPFETRASRPSTSYSTMSVSQRIYNTAGGYRTHKTTLLAKYAGDGHNHWHVQRVASYELFAKSGAGSALRRGSKVGFCFFDTNAYRLSLPRAPATRRYFQSGCGTRSSIRIKNGISVGWSDVYPWDFAWQWIDVTGLPAGEYLLKVTADPRQQFEELVEENNCNWTRIRIPKTGSFVGVLGSGSGCVLPVSPPPSPTPTPSASPTPTPSASPNP
jgi:hypothetical protein